MHSISKDMKKPEYEADDIIGTLAIQAAKEMKVKVFTGDKDFLQLVDDNVEVVLTKKGHSEVEAYDRKGVLDRYEI